MATPASAGTRRPGIRRRWSCFPDRRAEFLEGGRGLPLGAGTDTRYTQEIVELPVGSTLVLYSDGLVERRGESIDEGLERLRVAVAKAPRRTRSSSSSTCCRDGGRESGATTSQCWRCGCSRSHRSRCSCACRATSARSTSSATRCGVWLARAPVTGPRHTTSCSPSGKPARMRSSTPSDRPRGRRSQVWADLTTRGAPDRGRRHRHWSAPSGAPDRGFGLRLMRAAMTSVEIDSGEHGHAGDAREVSRRSPRARRIASF